MKWIVGILEEHKIPFQIAGGLAARIYGATRPINDVDIDIPEDRFEEILETVKPYIIYGPAQYKDERWDTKLMTLNFQGQEIDISGAYLLKICDARTGVWQHISTDLSKVNQKIVFGISVPVIPVKELVEYKSMLVGEHQKHDIDAIKHQIKE